MAGLKAGTVQDFSNSMAEAMANALSTEYQRIHNRALPSLGSDELKLMFSAIAQGVVRHLVDHASDAFQIDVDVEQRGPISSEAVVSENAASIPVTSSGFGGLRVATGAAQVRQTSGSVKSSGTGEVTQIRVDGELH